MAYMVDAKIVSLSDSDAVLDWLWERGDEVEAVIVRSDLRVPDLLEVVERDWPNIKLQLA
jgi:hypothetical protein